MHQLDLTKKNLYGCINKINILKLTLKNVNKVDVYSNNVYKYQG